ncbi:MAG TPA: nucleotidyl transferase AbiEii/AbiGii toxin family protein [Sulfurimonas sp.]|uniref:nucleotidyl transferase AbiEii/AbiGii toxin family protein n=1 Tax=Sulfurimonas sp. TaxID=2022749 RepID=UPI002D0B3588|nr:nucleotidyl transferase AbiEii/AbiGii toxin family protein [Sulfurimonas sp.]HUH43417.1 nucleotidyl transferase AbiEii/AbiGii toxin family protein [Sulfurimonas sp.]
MSGYLKNFKIQIETLNKVYYELIQGIENQVSLKNWWVFGGGTALAMFHFNHRKSFDVDIFITEAQVFDFLNPKWYIDETALFDQNEYRFDGMKNHVQLKTKDDIKVDFLLNEAIINKPILNTIIPLEFKLYYESIEDIIAKKVKWRKEDNLTRDIFDLAVAISKNDDILKDLIESRFISYDDLDKLNESLNSLNQDIYNLELEKIEPQGKEYLDIAYRAKDIIQMNIRQIK